MKMILIATAASATLAGLAYAQSTANKLPPASLLAEYPGFGHRSDEDLRAFVADEAKRQQIIFQCMRDAGFEYYPETAAVVRNNPTPAAAGRKPRQKSRNAVYREGLPADKLKQYNLKLFGVTDPNSMTDLWDPNSPTGGGCSGDALRGVKGVFDASRSLGREYVAMRRSVSRAPKVTAAEANWAKCMAGRGHQFGSVAELRSAVYNQGEVPDRPKVPVDRLPAANAASEACLAESGYADAERAALTEAESGFVREHKAKLDQLKYRR